MKRLERTVFAAIAILVMGGMYPGAMASDESADGGWRALNKYAAEAWEQGRHRMLDILELQEDARTRPAHALFARDRGDVLKDIDALLEDVLELFRVSAVTDYRARYAEFDARIAGLRQDVRRLREARMTAADGKSFLGFFKRTRAQYDARIEATEAQIAELEEEKSALVERLREAYARMGLTLSRKQVRFYLSSVSGRDIMALSAVFDNVKAINAQLESLLKETRGDPEAARRYYGLHVVMVRTVVKAHEVVMRNIEKSYLPRIARLAARNADVRRETEKLMRRKATEDQRRILSVNLEAQRVTDEALALYRRHLENARQRIEQALLSLRQREKIARNAYDTISISSALAAEMQTAIEDLAALRALHLPELIPFDNEALQQRFTEITAALEAD